MEMILLFSPLMLRGRTTLVQGNKVKDFSWDSKKEENESATIATDLATMLESVLTRRIIQGMMTTTTTTITKKMAIKGTKAIKKRGMHPLLDMEMVVLPKDEEIPSMRKVML